MAEAQWIDVVWTDLVGRSRIVRSTREACEAGEVRVAAEQISAGFVSGRSALTAAEAVLAVDWSASARCPGTGHQRLLRRRLGTGSAKPSVHAQLPAPGR